jgi:hypothetical protein
MSRVTNVFALVVLAGVASATPAFGREREIDCPAMPTTNDVEGSRSGGLSFQVGGFGLSGNRARSRSETDVMMRYGGFEDWSAAATLSHSCESNRRLYGNDLRRQRDEFIALRERLLARRSSSSQSGQTASQGNIASRGLTFAEMWEPLGTAAFMPRAAQYAGLSSGTVEVDCRMSQQFGFDDCYPVTESPSGYGFGAAAARYLGALRLRDQLRTFYWSERRMRVRVIIANNM